MAEVRPLEEAARRFTDNASRAVELYRDQAMKAATKWQENALKQNDYWAAQVATAAAKNRRLRNIQAVGAAGYASGIERKGPSRFREGVSMAADDWRAGFEPIARAIEGVPLKPKTADFKANIANNLIPIVEAMKKAAGKL